MSRVGALIALLLAAAATGCSLLAERLDALVNPVEPHPAPVPDDDSLAFHHGLLVVDLHADTLLWGRDLLQQSNFGHADLPRLRKGNVAIQIFTAVTKAILPRSHEDGETCVDGEDGNLAGLLSFLQSRPPRLWFDLEERALDQAGRLHRFAEHSRDADGVPDLIIIKTVDDLDRVIQRTQGSEAILGALLGLEGVHWLGHGSDPFALKDAVGRLYDAGFRMLALTHRFDNDLAGASEGCGGGEGLTTAGRIVLAEATDRGMIIDLAHASRATLLSAAADARGPVVVSHTGVQASCTTLPCRKHRNLADDEIQAVARTGGVIGIGYWPEAVGHGVEAIVTAMEKALDALRDPGFRIEMEARYGTYDAFDHIALGSDFDGAVKVPFDAANLAILTTAMRRRMNAEGTDRIFPDAAIRKIAGGNVCRVLAKRLPGSKPESASVTCAPWQ